MGSQVLEIWLDSIAWHLIAHTLICLQAGEIDHCHSHVTCLPQSERRKTISLPQASLLSLCHCYHSNQYGFNIGLWTPGSLGAVLVHSAAVICSPLLGSTEARAVQWPFHPPWVNKMYSVSITIFSIIHKIIYAGMCPLYNVLRVTPHHPTSYLFKNYFSWLFDITSICKVTQSQITFWVCQLLAFTDKIYSFREHWFITHLDKLHAVFFWR